MSELVSLQTSGRVATLTLRRPEARNALSVRLLESFLHGVRSVPAEASVLVIAGEGKSFCAGMDLKAVLDDAGNARRLLGLLGEVTLAIRESPCVSIARVHGAAIGGGCGLACVTDYAATHADSKMGFPEVDLGVCPAVVAPWVVRRTGPGVARRVLLLGGVMTGREAASLGLATHLVESADQLDAEVDRLASKLAGGGPKALAATKSLLNVLDHSTDKELMHAAVELSAKVLTEPEAQSRLRAVLDRPNP